MESCLNGLKSAVANRKAPEENGLQKILKKTIIGTKGERRSKLGVQNINFDARKIESLPKKEPKT